jgi:hypothetical protein
MEVLKITLSRTEYSLQTLPTQFLKSRTGLLPRLNMAIRCMQATAHAKQTNRELGW